MPGFDPDQPRDEKGQWTSTGMASALRSAASDKFNYKIIGAEGVVESEPPQIFNDPVTGERYPIEAESDITKQALIQAASDATVGGAIDLQKIDPEFREPVLKEIINNQMAGKSIDEKVAVVEDAIKLQDYESAAAFDDNGKLIKFVDGNEGSVQFEPDEIKGAAVMTHNHPMDISFSNGDVYAAVSNKIKEIHATTIDSVQVFRPNLGYRYTTDNNQFIASAFYSYMFAYDEEANNVLAEFQDRIKTNGITQQYANHEYQHRVMEKLAERTGSYYKVIPKPIPANVPRTSPLFGEPDYDYFNPNIFATR